MFQSITLTLCLLPDVRYVTVRIPAEFDVR